MRKALAPLLALLLAGCAYNEDLGRSQFLIVDNAGLAKASEEAWQDTLSKGKISTDPQANARVRRIGARLVEAVGMSDKPWLYTVFDDPTANAFVLPGAQVGVNTGLLAIVQNDDQLAAVIGHEIGHMAAQHGAERYSQSAVSQAVLVGAGQALSKGDPEKAKAIASLGGVGVQLGVLLPFSRKHELEADALGLGYMAKAGYRPSEAAALWRNMAAARNSGRTPQFMSTHPSDEARIQQIEALVKARGWN